jgi:hypothetical protein
MANSFTKQEQVMFDNVIEGFDDMLVIAKGAEKFDPPSAQDQDRARDKFWLPAPMIGSSFSGFDASANFGDVTQISVPASIGFHRHSAKAFTSKNLRNQFALDQWGKAAKQKLASDVNLELFNTAALQGGIFSKRTAAPAGFDDVADIDARMTEIGIGLDDRMAFYSPRSMNSMAGNLASRAEDSKRSRTAYERALINSDVAGIAVFKNDQSIRLAAATGGAVLINGANQRTVPAATTTASTGETENKDNRYTDLVVDGGTYANIKVGDAFTIANVFSIHLITKQSTGQLKTFRVVGKPAANTIRVYPAIIDAAEGSAASKEYANVSAGPADDAPLTWLNTTAADLNPFFKKESLLILPGSYAVDPEDGWQSMTATTDFGISITYTRQGNINDLSVKARFDIDFGTALVNPEMAGCQMFGQA